MESNTAGGPGFEIAKDGVGSLVVGVDGSDPSMDALAFAVGLARRESAELIVVFVMATSAFAHFAPDPAAAWASVSQVGDELEERVCDGLRAGDYGMAWRFVRRRGDVARELETLAEETRSDALVVGRSGSPFNRILGSVPTSLLRIAPRPVIVVP